MDIGTAIKNKRKSLGLKQNDTAITIGITQTYLSQVEGNLKVPSIEVINKICDYFEIPISILLWNAITEDDIKADKREVFKQIQPLVNSLLVQLN